MAHIPKRGHTGQPRGWIWSGAMLVAGMFFLANFAFTRTAGLDLPWHSLCAGLGFLLLAPQAWRRPVRLRTLLRPGGMVDYPPSRSDLVGMAGLLLLISGLIMDLLH